MFITCSSTRKSEKWAQPNVQISKGTSRYPRESTLDTNTYHLYIYIICGSYNGCIGQYVVMFWGTTARVPFERVPKFSFWQKLPKSAFYTVSIIAKKSSQQVIISWSTNGRDVLTLRSHPRVGSMSRISTPFWSRWDITVKHGWVEKPLLSLDETTTQILGVASEWCDWKK